MEYVSHFFDYTSTRDVECFELDDNYDSIIISK